RLKHDAESMTLKANRFVWQNQAGRADQDWRLRLLTPDDGSADSATARGPQSVAAALKIRLVRVLRTQERDLGKPQRAQIGCEGLSIEVRLKRFAQRGYESSQERTIHGVLVNQRRVGRRKSKNNLTASGKTC